MSELEHLLEAKGILDEQEEVETEAPEKLATDSGEPDIEITEEEEPIEEVEGESEEGAVDDTEGGEEGEEAKPEEAEAPERIGSEEVEITSEKLSEIAWQRELSSLRKSQREKNVSPRYPITKWDAFIPPSITNRWITIVISECRASIPLRVASTRTCTVGASGR